MNYYLDDKKCHKDDLLIPPRGVYLELDGEIYETTDNVSVKPEKQHFAYQVPMLVKRVSN